MEIKNIGIILKNKEEVNIDVVSKVYHILFENKIEVYANKKYKE